MLVTGDGQQPRHTRESGQSEEERVLQKGPEVRPKYKDFVLETAVGIIP